LVRGRSGIEVGIIGEIAGGVHVAGRIGGHGAHDILADAAVMGAPLVLLRVRGGKKEGGQGRWYCLVDHIRLLLVLNTSTRKGRTEMARSDERPVEGRNGRGKGSGSRSAW